MPIIETPQKAFYDKIRPFQGHDSPKPRDAEVPASVPSKIPVGQLIAGVIVLGLIALAFIKFAAPEAPIGLDKHGKPIPVETTPAPVAPAKH